MKMLFEADENKPGTSGNVTLWANDKQIAEGKMPQTVPIAFSTYAGMDISRDNGLVDAAFPRIENSKRPCVNRQHEYRGASFQLARHALRNHTAVPRATALASRILRAASANSSTDAVATTITSQVTTSSGST